MPRLSKLRERLEPFKIEIAGETISGHYRPYSITGKRLEELTKRIADDGNATKANAEAIAELVADWDLMGEDDKPIALDVETLAENVPPSILTLILVGLGNQQAPPARSSRNLRGSFGAAAN